MKIAVLTSSRADYSIYLPLLKKIKEDNYFDLSIIAFGTHLSSIHGNTVNSIIDDGFDIAHQLETIVTGDTPDAVNSSMALVINKFSGIWATTNYDLVLALGDRFEMFAAVLSTVSYNIKIAHIHGGEITLGAIDNVLRHSISLMSSIHFASTNDYKQKIVNLIGTDKNVYNVGALSVENMMNLELYSLKEFKERFDIDMSKPTILSTFHPETISYKNNLAHIKELLGAFDELKQYQILITMPNIDTMGNYIRQAIEEFTKIAPNVIAVESLGTIGYLSAIKHSVLMVGNSSSGFVDASLFPRKVINIGERQSGRIITPNIYNCIIEKNEILNSINLALSSPKINKVEIYGDGTTSNKIIKLLKDFFNKNKHESN